MSYNPNFVGSQANGSSIALVTNYTNGNPTAIPQGTPLSITGSFVYPTNVSSDVSVASFVSYAQVRIAANATGPVISGGRLENLTGYSFSLGDPIYMSISGSLQNVRPDDGVTGFGMGDFIVFCGTIVPNIVNPSNQDLQILSQVFGEL
jgi:hypothetical protein